ncbi:ATP-binding protein [Desertihabitans brevis]|uniref:ATP-binding protein n=1 Tax=Desertihabitans brevis TaxID=2268447 RepID=A0A367YVR9_9ACTN|nr:ATP-binding protein [Desertihabitans brevis]RCK69908.1 ATP-binding protein [Desertihabitans brevis]
MREPLYTPGAGRVPPELVGRDAVLERWTGTLSTARGAAHLPKDVVHTGPPGAGRTVLLGRALELAAGEGYRVLRVDGRPGAWLRDALAPELATLGLRLDLLDADETAALAERVARLPGFLAEVLTDLAGVDGEGRGLVVGIDDLHLVDPEEAGRLGVAVELMETPPDAPVLLVATGGPDTWERLRGDGLRPVNDHPEKWFDLRPLPALSEEEASRALQRPAERVGVRWEPEAVELVVATADGHPGRLQSAAAAVWALGSGTDPVTAAHARQALRSVELPAP